MKTLVLSKLIIIRGPSNEGAYTVLVLVLLCLVGMSMAAQFLLKIVITLKLALVEIVVVKLIVNVHFRIYY